MPMPFECVRSAYSDQFVPLTKLESLGRFNSRALCYPGGWLASFIRACPCPDRARGCPVRGDTRHAANAASRQRAHHTRPVL